MQKKMKTAAVAGTVLGAVLAVLLPFSCDIYEGLDPCPHGINLRFVFDYNMEYADAFSSKVHCYTLHVYNDEGVYLKSYADTVKPFWDEPCRLQMDLPQGSYHFVAYGGMACDRRSFELVSPPDSISNLQVSMLCHSDGTSDQLLHDFFYGAMDFTVKGDGYRDTVIRLMRNTNNIRILLQHLNGDPVPVEDFKFTITDDNTRFDAENRLVPNHPITYLPWTKDSVAGAGDSGKKITAVEFSTSRLCEGNANRLTVCRAEDHQTVLDLPLNQCLLLLKSERYAGMGAQEFLDRENDWSIVFFLDSGYKWMDAQIIINGWTVRLNDMDL